MLEHDYYRFELTNRQTMIFLFVILLVYFLDEIFQTVV